MSVLFYLNTRTRKKVKVPASAINVTKVPIVLVDNHWKLGKIERERDPNKSRENESDVMSFIHHNTWRQTRVLKRLDGFLIRVYKRL